MKWQPYPKYKNSGVEWLGDVPEVWGVKKICRLATLLTGKTEENNNPVALENIEGWTGKFISTESTFEGDGVAFKKGDILFGKLRPYLAKVYVAKKAGEAVGDFHVLRFNSAISSDFCGYLLRTSSFINHVNSSTYGAKMPRASWEFLGSMSIPIPSFVEQQAIAAFLDKETGRIDALMAKKKALIDKLKEQRTAIISNAVTKGLPDDVAPRYRLKPHTRFKPSGVEWLGDMPEHWRQACLRWLSKIYSGGTPDKSNPDFWSDGTIPWLNSGAVNQNEITKPSDFITKEGFRSSSAKWIPPYALLMALAGQGKTKGMVAQLMFEATCNQSMAAIIPTSMLTSRYLYWWLTSNYQNIRNLSGGDNRDGLNLVLLGNIRCPIPNQHEQQAIAAYLDEQTGKIDALIAKLEQAITTLQEYRTALITAAVTGKIDVRHEAGMQEIS